MIICVIITSMKNLYKGFYGFTALAVFTAFLLPPLTIFAATNEGIATASNVLVVYNSAYTTDSNSDSTQDSLELANYYKTKRSIPDANVVGIDTPTTLAITRSDYNTYIKSPLETYLTDNNLKDTIKYIVFVKGIPMKVYDTSGPANNYVNSAGNHSSVDSSTLFLFQNNYSSTDGKIINPYFNSDPNLDLTYRFKSNTFGADVKIQYLVTRLDGYTVADVKNMIDRASNTDKSGTGYFVLDRYSGANNFGFDSIANTSTILKNLGKNIYPDPFTTGSSAIKTISNSVMGYTSYGIYAGLGNDFFNNELDFNYLNGAVTSTYESYTAFSNVEPDNTNFGQIYQFIRAGGSGGVGNVYEPFTNGLPNDSIYMPAYSVGYTWADAAYMSLPVINWQAIVVGDPLMRIANDNISAPTLTTGTVSNTSATSITLSGNISNTGGEDNIVRGFRYGTTNAYGNFVKETGAFSTGDFSLDLDSLTCNTTYYYQAYSANSFRSGFGSGSTFTTSACAVPIIETDPAIDTTISTAKLNAKIIDVGQDAVTDRGFEIGLTNSYGSITTQDGNFSSGAFTITVDGLECYTTYHYRAFAKNSVGTGYGNDQTFTTSYNCKPTITTNVATYISGNSYSLNADIKRVGEDVVTERGFEMGTTTNYGTIVKENGTFGGSFGYVSKFGSYGSGSGQFNEPRSVAVDSNGNIYVVDRLNHRVQKFDSSGNFVTKWGSFGSGNTQFKYPRGIAVDSSNNIYVADSDNHRIQKFDSNGNFITKWGNYGTGNGKISYPQDVVIDSNNNVYVSDYDNSRITKFSSTGSYITKWGSYGSGDGQFKPAYDLGIDSNNNIYVADKNNNRVQKFDSSGNFISKFGSFGSGDGDLSSPSGILGDIDDNVYIADGGGYIKKFDSNGIFVSKVGGAGNVNGSFIDPQGMAFDSIGNIYVADSSNARIQKISTNGLFSIVVNNLKCGSTYNYRAYAVNTVGTSYGSNETFTVPVCLSTVSTDATTNITASSAKMLGNITDLGGATPTLRGFEYGLDTNYGSVTRNNPEGSQTIGVGTYSANLKNLSCGTTYNYRAYVTNSAGTAYGENKTFTTNACSNTPPTTPGTPATVTPTKDTTPTFAWTASSSVNGLNSSPYLIEISKDNTFATGVTNATSNTNSYTASTLTDGLYYIRVKAKDTMSQVSNYSNTGNVLIDNVAPPIPANITGTTPTSDTTPTISWDTVNDDNTGGSGMHPNAPYSIVYAKDSNFSVGKTVVNITTNSFTPATALSAGKWYFHVRSRDKAVNPSEYGGTLEIVIQ